jgi:hypothetical protein
MNPDLRIDLLHASGGSLAFYNRILEVRAKEYRGALAELDYDTLPTLEAQFTEYGNHLERLQVTFPEDTELLRALEDHAVRKVSLGV